MRIYRIDWMGTMQKRDMRMPDVVAIGNLEQSVTFFASTTILILAGLLTAATAGVDTLYFLESLPMIRPITPLWFELKLLVLTAIFVSAFFRFTWALRQYNFATILVVSTPAHNDNSLDEATLKRHAYHTANMLNRAANTNNYGLRAYYFAMAALGWFIHPLIFAINCALVVWILYHREFRSGALRDMLAIRGWKPGPMARPTQHK
jgi:uncharacterized membrane protein